MTKDRSFLAAFSTPDAELEEISNDALLDDLVGLISEEAASRGEPAIDKETLAAIITGGAVQLRDPGTHKE